jgi:hypothetical protein
MAINKALKGATRKVEWNGVEAAEVRGLSPNDVFGLLNEEGNGVKSLIVSAENLGIKAGMPIEQIAAQIEVQAPQLFVALAEEMPKFLAKLIALAADDESAWEHVMEHWPIALQFMAVSDIAALSFGGVHGFRMFVGNVLALAGIVGTMTEGVVKGERRHTPIEPQPSADGSET